MIYIVILDNPWFMNRRFTRTRTRTNNAFIHTLLSLWCLLMNIIIALIYVCIVSNQCAAISNAVTAFNNWQRSTRKYRYWNVKMYSKRIVLPIGIAFIENRGHKFAKLLPRLELPPLIIISIKSMHLCKRKIKTEIFSHSMIHCEWYWFTVRLFYLLFSFCTFAVGQLITFIFIW